MRVYAHECEENLKTINDLNDTFTSNLERVYFEANDLRPTISFIGDFHDESKYHFLLQNEKQLNEQL